MFVLSLLFSVSSHSVRALPGPVNPPEVPVSDISTQRGQPLDDLVDDLPIVVRDLPDERSRFAVEQYDQAHLLVSREVNQAFAQAWDSLVVPPNARKHTQALRHLLETSQWGTVPGTTAPRISARALAALADDPYNADRLNNAVVALFSLGVSVAHGEQLATADGGSDEATGETYVWGVQDSALWLLGEVQRVFGPSRAVLLNQAYFSSVTPSSDYPLAPAIKLVEQQLRTEPSDRTARFLLGNLQSRQADNPDALEAATQTLRPLLEHPGTASLGHAALGDAHLAVASLKQVEAPFLARDLAERALEEYNLALRSSGDPGLHAGRAAALDLLGDTEQAVDAQRWAVQTATDSVDFLLTLATLREKAGDAQGMQASARKALSLTMDDWNPLLREVRLVSSRGFGVTPARDYMGFSVGSGRDHAGVWRTPQGGGYILTDDAIPRTNDRDVIENRRTGFAPDQAALAAISADLLLQADSTALQDAQLWFDRTDADPRLAGHSSSRERRDASIITAYWAAHLAANPEPSEEFYANVGEDPTVALWFAQNELRRAGKFVEAAKLCERVAELPRKRGFSITAAQQCLGESSYLAKDYTTAFAALRKAARQSEAEAGTVVNQVADGHVLLHIRAASAAQAIDRDGVARQMLRLAATDDTADPLSASAAFNELGDLGLDDGDSSGARSHYELSLAVLDAAELEPPGEEPEIVARARALANHAHNNRGISLLRLSQEAAAVPPDCAVSMRQSCVLSRRDSALAVRADPRNPVYLLNLGWAARLLGDFAGARDALSRAVDADPTLFPALNDLGVLAAEAGDQAAAQEAFTAALRAEPKYDLAAWNLGVLDMRQGVDGIPSGQAHLARAIALNPSLRTESLEFKTDERIYRVTFNSQRRVEKEWAFGRGYSLAATGLTAFTLLSTVGQFRSSTADRLAGTVTDLGLPRLRDLGTWASGRGKRRLGGRRLHPRWRRWAPWLITVPVLLLVTAWPAWRSNPETGVATVTLAVLAAALTVLVHEIGHAAVARLARAKVSPAQWTPGVVLALLFLPLQLSSGPFVGQRVSGDSGSRAWWVYISGPLANATLGVVAYGLFLLYPMPALRLLAQVQLAAIAYALLPYEPLDGAALSEQRPAVMAVLSLALGSAAAAFAFGLL